MRPRKIKNHQGGFTIVELMIALSILSTILIVSTAVLMQIGSIYTKGVNEANVQNATRTIVADLTATLQFSGFAPDNCVTTPTTCYSQSPAPSDLIHGPFAFCVGNTRYSYLLDRELGTDSDLTNTPHVLWRDTIKQGLPCNPLNLNRQTVLADPSSANYISGVPQPSDGYEMLGNKMRLTKFLIAPSGSASGDLYNIDVRITFGDHDLLTPDPNISPDPNGNESCIGNTGDQFCAASEINSTVGGRTY